MKTVENNKKELHRITLLLTPQHGWESRVSVMTIEKETPELYYISGPDYSTRIGRKRVGVIQRVGIEDRVNFLERYAYCPPEEVENIRNRMMKQITDSITLIAREALIMVRLASQPLPTAIRRGEK